jgi:hypothetical protein
MLGFCHSRVSVLQGVPSKTKVGEWLGVKRAENLSAHDEFTAALEQLLSEEWMSGEDDEAYSSL